MSRAWLNPIPRYPSRLVSATGRAQVRRVSASRLSRPPTGLTGGGGAGGPFCARKPRLGVRPNRGCACQSGPSDLGPNGWQHLAPAQPRPSAGAESHDDLEGVHSVTRERARRRRLLYRGGADLARTSEVLRAILHRSNQPPRIVGRHQAPPGLVLDGASGAERWVCFIKEECLSEVRLFGERLLRRVVSD